MSSASMSSASCHVSLRPSRQLLVFFIALHVIAATVILSLDKHHWLSALALIGVIFSLVRSIRFWHSIADKTLAKFEHVETSSGANKMRLTLAGHTLDSAYLKSRIVRCPFGVGFALVPEDENSHTIPTFVIARDACDEKDYRSLMRFLVT